MIPRSNRVISNLEDIDSVLRSVSMALKCSKDKFYPNKDYGSRLKYNMGVGELIARARCAVEQIDGVYIKSAKLNGNLLEIIVLINDTERSVSINLEQDI